MTKRIAAIVFIFACTSIAWFILGATIWYRTDSVDSRLRDRVVSIWGAPHEQAPPTAFYQEVVPKTVSDTESGKPVARTVYEAVSHDLPLESSRITVALDLEHRQKGLLWYSTYKVAFSGLYSFRNPSTKPQSVTFVFHFPAAKAIYDDLAVAVDGDPLTLTYDKAAAKGTARIEGQKQAQLQVSYRSQGLDTWQYQFGGEVAQVRDFHLKVTTDFKDVDFGDDTLAPTEKRALPGGWELVWSYNNLVSGVKLGVLMPRKLQPGPLAGRISYFAPVSLFFFFFLMFIITTIRQIELHPMNYFFLAAAFFSFHLLLAYLVDHISIHAAFLISSVVSIFLVVSYLRLVVGIRFALVEAGLSQFIYLVLFSYAFFLEGFTGLAVTIGSIVTLFVVMQMTGRVRWSEKFARSAP